MEPVLHLLSTLPAFLAYLGTAIALLAVFAALYTAVTPHAEWKLLREGNVSAATAFGGALLGFTVPLASAIAHSVSLLDMLVWGLVALAVQLLAFFAAWAVVRRLPSRIESDDRATALFAAVLFLCAGLLNAACMTW